MSQAAARPSGQARRERALVLGGGGSAGNAWLLGVTAGLLAGGLDVTDADLIIGTSAGATAAAQITAANPAQLYADVLTAVPPRRPGPSGTANGPSGPGSGPSRPAGGPSGPPSGPSGSVADHMRVTAEIIAAATDPADLRRRLGAASLELDAGSDGSAQARWRSIVATRLPSPEWPKQLVYTTAIDACTGEPVVFDRYSGVELVDAVAASTDNGFGMGPYEIGDSRYLDGGYRRSAENADLAAGYERVLVLSPLGGRTRTPRDWGTQLATQVEELRAAGSTVETIMPDDATVDSFGTLMDPGIRPPAARAGYEQGKARAAQLTEFWLR
ncbi:patatin-like phospholipase family protein [Nocardia yunnanensis]|uniref:Patatin-like phospholipase family protein n=1 Tax=Nocardia yunnanensis TaxID=2382165 RepID=A0A386ZT28_9NOCA|nr:patatin-like phospholipase family protein [Nocardia yunnanensis]